MKSIVMPESEQLKKENNDQLFGEVKETVANMIVNHQNGPKKQFTVSDMWNRQRQMRSASDRIRKWNLN